jgi:hypothetical protein
MNREAVLDFLRNLPENKSAQFNYAFELYRLSENANQMQIRSLNMSGFSDSALANLLYDLQKLHEITDTEIYDDQTKVITLNNLRCLPRFVLDMTQDDLEAWAHTDCVGVGVGLDEIIDIAIEEGNEFVAAILCTEQVAILKAQKNNLPENDLSKNDIPNLDISDKPVREEFPFLANADCPDEFKILIADKLTSYNLYKETKERVSAPDAEKVYGSEELARLAKIIVESFDDNQKIYAELNHYKETGEILGKHSIFRKVAMQREIDAMTQKQLMAFVNSSSKYFSDNKTQLAVAEKAKDADKIAVIKNRVQLREEKLALVNKKLGIEK